MRYSLAILALTLPVTLLAAQVAPYTVTETGRTYTRLQDAVDAIGAGRGTIRFASGRFADCAVQSAGDVTYLAAAAGESVLEGRACEDKAALVLRGRGASVEGLVFARMAVSDGNGAGIRLEHGDLAVAQSWFRDSQQGILTGDDPQARITIDKSTFTRLGTCEFSGGCAHSIYVGDYGSLAVTRSRFEAGRGGHYLKTRARRIEATGNSFDDSAGKATNYMIDLSNGAAGRIQGNWFVQGADKENHSAFITVAPEGRTNSAAGLVVADNEARLAPGASPDSTFVADWSGDALTIHDNRLAPGLKLRDRR